MKKAILISCFDWYTTRLQPIREYLIEKGYQVIVLTSDFEHISKKPVQKRFKECTYISVPRYKKNLSVQRMYSHLKFGKEIDKFIYKDQPDLIYALLPPNNIGKYILSYKKKYPKTKVVIDIIDLWPESMPLNKLRNIPGMNIWRSWRNRAIENANFIFTECGMYNNVLKDQLINIDHKVLHLFKDQDDETAAIVRSNLGHVSKCDNISFAYVGSMNHILDIDGICRVITSFIEEGYKCALHAIGIGENKEEFKKQVENTGCNCIFYGAVFEEKEKAKILSCCDYAFNMMKDTSAVGLTIKSIDYFSLGLPIINNIKGDTWELVEKMKIGYNVDQNNKIRNIGFIDHQQVYKVYNDMFTRQVYIKNIEESLSEIVC